MHLSCLLNTKTRTFVNKIKAEDNGKIKQRKKAETWMKLFIDSQKVCQSPYDIFAEMNDKENELTKTIEEQAANLYEQMTEAGMENLQDRGRRFSDVGWRQQQRHLSQYQ